MSGGTTEACGACKRRVQACEPCLISTQVQCPVGNGYVHAQSRHILHKHTHTHTHTDMSVAGVTGCWFAGFKQKPTDRHCWSGERVACMLRFNSLSTEVPEVQLKIHLSLV